MKKTLRFGRSGDAPIRFFYRDGSELKFCGSVHERIDTQGKKVGFLRQGFILHNSYQDLTDYFQKFNDYTRIAEKHLASGKKPPASLVIGLRFPFEFVQRYFLRLGFLDGYPGYIYALISSVYAVIKNRQLKEAVSGKETLIL